MLWILLGWRFTLAEFLGGVVLIVLMTVLLRLFVSRKLEEEAREHARTADTGHVHPAAASSLPLRRRLVSADAWSDVAHNFRGDWQMLWKEIGDRLPARGLRRRSSRTASSKRPSCTTRPRRCGCSRTSSLGPLIAVVSFVCSVGNIPLAAVLWSGGISFAGVLAFIFADLIVLPIIAIYRKYYGSRFALRIVALMFVTMALAALVDRRDLRCRAASCRTRGPIAGDVFMPIGLDYKLVLNVLGLVVFAALIALTLRRGATDPMCGMTVDRSKALTRSSTTAPRITSAARGAASGSKCGREDSNLQGP